MTGPDIAIAIRCPACHKTGVATWRERRNGGRDIRCDIVQLSDGFLQKDGDGNDARIVCAQCGMVVPG